MRTDLRARVLYFTSLTRDVRGHRSLLEADGWTVEPRSEEDLDGLEARPHVALLDLRSGAPARRTARILRAYEHLPIIAIGSCHESERREVVRGLGLHGLYDVSEPPDRLLELVESAAGLVSRSARTLEEQDLRSLLVAKLCHDLRGALHAIRGYGEMLAMDDPAVEMDVVRDRVGRLSHDALEITSRYLDLARLDSTERGGERLDAVRLDALLAELRDAAVARIGDRPIDLSASSGTPGAVIRTDERKLRAVLFELLVNAIKFTAAGRVRLAARSGEGYAEFHVTDDGSGMDGRAPGTTANVFEQVRDALLAPVPGQGIGLAMALRLTEQLGGTLSFEPASTGGTAFRLLLPDWSVPGEAEPVTYH